MKRMSKNQFKESDLARLNDLARRHGLSFKRIGMVFRFEDFTAYGLDQALGYVEGFDRAIASVPQSVIDKFSKRTHQIEAEAKRLGITDPGEKSELAAKTRSKKQQSLTPDELRKARDEQLTDDERDALAFIEHAADLGD